MDKEILNIEEKLENRISLTYDEIELLHNSCRIIYSESSPTIHGEINTSVIELSNGSTYAIYWEGGDYDYIDFEKYGYKDYYNFVYFAQPTRVELQEEEIVVPIIKYL